MPSPVRLRSLEAFSKPVTNQRRSLWRPSFFETFRSPISASAQPISTSAPNYHDGDQNYFPPGYGSSQLPRAPQGSQPRPQIVILQDERSNASSTGRKRNSDGKYAVSTTGVVVAFSLLIVLAFSATAKALYKNGMIPFTDKKRAAEYREIERQALIARLKSKVASLESEAPRGAPPLVQGMGSAVDSASTDVPSGLGMERAEEWAQELGELQDALESARATVVTMQDRNRRIHHVLFDFLQNSTPGASSSPAHQHFVRDDELLHHNPITFPDTDFTLPASHASLIRLVDSSGKNHALLLGLDMRAFESSINTALGLHTFAHPAEKATAWISVARDYLMDLGERLHEQDENSCADLALYIWEPRVILNCSLAAAVSDYATFLKSHDFPPGWPLKHMKAVPGVEHASVTGLRNRGEDEGRQEESVAGGGAVGGDAAGQAAMRKRDGS